MPKKTKVREQLPSLLEMLRRLTGSGSLSSALKGLMGQLESLGGATKYLYAPQQDGSFKPLDPETQKQLSDSYTNAMILSKQVFSISADKPSLRDLTGKIMDMLEADMSIFKGEIPDNISLPELVEQKGLGNFADMNTKLPEGMEPIARVDIEIPAESSLSIEKGAMSKRKLVSFTDENGVEHKGYYTSGVELDLKKNIGLDFCEARANYPQYSDYLRLLESYYAEDKGYVNGNKTLPGFSQGDMAALNEDPDFVKMHEELNQKLSSTMLTQKTYFNSMGAEAGETIETRNVAMTRMAELMGTPKLLAKSFPMRLKQGDLIDSGVFMENAEGIDIAKLQPGSPMENFTEEVYSYGPGLKSLSQIEVLDYICGNVDRHTGNMFYHFENIDGKPRFTGVTGIDNDMSFISANERNSNSFISNEYSLRDLSCISKSQADFIRSFDPDQVGEALKGCRLSSNDVAGVVQRIEALKARIENNEIPVYTDEDFNGKTLSDLEKGINIFNKVKSDLIGEKISNRFARNENKAPGRFIHGERTVITDEQMKSSQEGATRKQTWEEWNAIHGHESGKRKIIMDRLEMADELKAEQAERSKVQDPFRQDRLGEFKDKINALDKSFNKANHFFGGSDEFEKAIDAFDDLKVLIEKGLNTPEKDMQFLEDAKEQLSYTIEAAKALKEKTAGSTRANQADRHSFASKLEEFSNSLMQEIKDYDMARLQNQDELIDAQRTGAAKEAFVFQRDNFGGEYNPGLDSEIIPYTIKNGIDQLANSIYSNNAMEPEKALDLTAAVLVNESIKHAAKQNPNKTASLTDGKNRALLEYYKNDPQVQELARDLVANPQGFAKDLVKGNMDTVYQQFIASKAALGTEMMFMKAAGREQNGPVNNGLENTNESLSNPQNGPPELQKKNDGRVLGQ